MLAGLSTLLWFLVAISLLVGVHEWGHFFVARRLGVRVERFSIGFGPVLYRWHGKDGVEYAISAIPLGGYVKMLGEAPEAVEALPEPERRAAFAAQPPFKRILIAAAGPFANFAFAVGAYALVAWLGVSAYPALVGAVMPGSAAAQAGIQPADRIVRIEQERVRSWQDAQSLLRAHAGESVRVVVDRGGAETEVALRLPEAHARMLGDPMAAVGIVPPVVVEVVGVRKDAPAARAGIRKGDRVLAVNGQPVRRAQEVGAYVRAAKRGPIVLEIEREGQRLSVRVAPEATPQGPRIGVALGERWSVEPFTLRRGPIEGLIWGVEETGRMVRLTLDVIAGMLTRAISTDTLGGPIAIAKLSGQAAEAGLVAFLAFLAVISVNLGVLNLLPVPVLDGGHIVLAAIEGFIRRPIPPKVLTWVQGAGLVLIAALMGLALFNDITRWFAGQ